MQYTAQTTADLSTFNARDHVLPNSSKSCVFKRSRNSALWGAYTIIQGHYSWDERSMDWCRCLLATEDNMDSSGARTFVVWERWLLIWKCIFTYLFLCSKSSEVMLWAHTHTKKRADVTAFSNEPFCPLSSFTATAALYVFFGCWHAVAPVYASATSAVASFFNGNRCRQID